MSLASDPFAAAISTKPQRSVRGSSWPAYAALAVAAMAVLLVAVPVPLSVGLIGYVLAAVVAPALVVVYRAMQRRAQRDVRYIRRLMPRRIATLAIIVGLAAGATHAWMIATELAKR